MTSLAELRALAGQAASRGCEDCDGWGYAECSHKTVPVGGSELLALVAVAQAAQAFSGLRWNAPGEQEREARRALRVALAALAADQEQPCEVCGGAGVVDENGNRSVWGRTDSRECSYCDGSGWAADQEPGK